MVSTLDIAAVSQFGVDNRSPLEGRRKASLLFARALGQGRRRSLWRRLTRREYRLNDLSRLAGHMKRQAAPQTGVILVPLVRIVGSENRVADFDSAFHPLNPHNSDRWIGIAAARRAGVPLPPVELIQVGDEFYVRDGHHRISVARAAGQEEIEAQITYVLSA